MLYRIITEDRNYIRVKELVSSYFDGFTIYKANGVYGLESEDSLIIEIDTLDNVQEDCANWIKYIVQNIKEMNSQDCVLLQKINCESQLV